MFNLLSANAFNLFISKILLFGKGLKSRLDDSGFNQEITKYADQCFRRAFQYQSDKSSGLIQISSKGWPNKQ